MDVITGNALQNNKTMTWIVGTLALSVVLLISCNGSEKEQGSVEIGWKGGKAESIIISRLLLDKIPQDSIGEVLKIHLIHTTTPILGEYIMEHEAVIFRPLIAFTPGLKYEVRLAKKLISEIEILPNDLHEAPVVVTVYPTGDTLPVNLLKIYIRFSKPMEEGQALKNIQVIRNNADTIPLIFLDLQQELWNKERTILTLWLDPGRIKRDLQPNKKLGPPLLEGSSYQIFIKKDWRDIEGVFLANPYRKNFVVSSKDSLSPNPKDWTVELPKTGSSQSLEIELHEQLDYILLKNTVRILDDKGNILSGALEPGAMETILNFIPSSKWQPGNYTVEIESRLEDLAGNNLNHLFDKDITRHNRVVQKQVYTRSFRLN